MVAYNFIILQAGYITMFENRIITRKYGLENILLQNLETLEKNKIKVIALSWAK